MAKSPEAFRTISEVADWLGTPAHVLRFWESRFTQVKPVKRAGGRRYYRPADMELLGGIKQLLHEDGMTIRGVQKLLRTEGVRHVASFSIPLDGQAPAGDLSDKTAPEPTPDVDDLVAEAPMSENVEPEPLDNLVALEPTQPEPDQAAGPAPDEAEVDDTEVTAAEVISPEMPAEEAPTASEAAEFDAIAPQPGDASAEPEPEVAEDPAPTLPQAAEPASPAPLFQSANQMRDTAEPVAPSVAEPTDEPAPPAGPQEPPQPVAPMAASEPVSEPNLPPAALGTDIPDDPAPDAQFSGVDPASLPNIISLAQAMRAERARKDAQPVDVSTMTGFYDRLMQLRDQMRGHG